MKLQRISTAGVLVREDTNHLRLSRVNGRPALPALGMQGRHQVRCEEERKRTERQRERFWLGNYVGRRVVADRIKQMARLRSPTPPLRDRRTWKLLL